MKFNIATHREAVTQYLMTLRSLELLGASLMLIAVFYCLCVLLRNIILFVLSAPSIFLLPSSVDDRL